MPTDMLEVAKKLTSGSLPRFVTMADKVTLKNVKQFYIPIEKEGYKSDALCNLRDMMVTNQAVVYCNSRQGTEQLSAAMRDSGITVSAIVSDGPSPDLPPSFTYQFSTKRRGDGNVQLL